MPNRRIDGHWRERIRELTEQNPRLSSRKIAERLEAEAREADRIDWPSEKTVRNIMAEHRGASERERRQYALAHWPESFENNPDLPWEAARLILEGMRIHGGKRPTVRAAKWLWRLSLANQASPDVDSRYALWDLAKIMAAVEASGLPGKEETWRGIERTLLNPGRAGETSVGPAFMAHATEEAMYAEGLREKIPEEEQEDANG